MALYRQYVTFRFTYDPDVLNTPENIIARRGDKVFNKDSSLITREVRAGRFTAEVVTTSQPIKVEDDD